MNEEYDDDMERQVAQEDGEQRLAEQDAWYDWWEKYADAFQERTGCNALCVGDDKMARNSYRKGISPERAAKEDANFMLTGE